MKFLPLAAYFISDHSSMSVVTLTLKKQ